MAHAMRRVSEARLFMRALGVSFFSLLSVFVALYAFTEMPQVQDLLFDERASWVQEAIYWTGFYAIGLLVWALPLAFTARLLLMQNFDLIGIDDERRYKFYIFSFPSIYVRLAFASVIIGIVAAADNLPVASDGDAYEAVLRKYLEVHLITLLVVTACALILVRSLFLWAENRSMIRMERFHPKRFKRTLIHIETLTRKRCGNLEELDLHLTKFKPDFLSEETWVAAQRMKVFMWLYTSRLTIILLALIAIHFLSYSDAFRRMFSMPDLSAYPGLQTAWDFAADALSLKRATLAFFLFGAWLPFATILALLSNRLQFPFIIVLIVVSVALTPLIGDGHDMRVAVLSPKETAAIKPPSFAEALQRWKDASGWSAKGCDRLSEGAPELASCPRPIIVAGEGGGSRAAFLLASVLGALEDESLDKGKGPDARPFHQQLFAISSVSGSSVGAAFFIGALKAQPEAQADRLKKALRRQRQWFPNVAELKPDEGVDRRAGAAGYKDSLQAALSNDFISPVLIAYLARDISTLSRIPGVMDRGGVLETAWEDAFNDVYGTSPASSPLSAPLQALAPTDGSWTPLLFMNATSAGTGRRILVTPVKINEPIEGRRAAFPKYLRSTRTDVRALRPGEIEPRSRNRSPQKGGAGASLDVQPDGSSKMRGREAENARYQAQHRREVSAPAPPSRPPTPMSGIAGRSSMTAWSMAATSTIRAS